MKNALILHGTGGSSQGNWFPWLKGKLEESGWKVWVPDLPGAESPNMNKYCEFLMGNKDWKFDDDSIVVGHSSGAVTILGLLQRLPDGTKIDRCYLVGAFKDDLGWESLRGMFEEPINFEKIKGKAKKIFFIHSDNDPHCPLDGAMYLASQTGGELIVKSGFGHFNLEAGEQYKELPFLQDLISPEEKK